MGASVALTLERGAVKSQVPTEGIRAQQGRGLGPGLGPGGCQLSIFSAFQVSHEFAINFNPTNPFCSGEPQASPHLPWASFLSGGRAEYRPTGFCTFLSPPPLAF